jgi:predicted O-methyltransferase YrrM
MKDLRYNEDIFTKLEFNVEGIKSELANNSMDYFNHNISWQHHIFLGLKLKNLKEKMNILEIGTFDGNFTNFLSNNFSASNIFSIDLLQDDKNFLTSYDRDNAVYLKEFLLKRDKNISNNNITFLPSDSISLIEKFEKNFFDMIFVDGDHLNPQVTIDIFTSTLLLKKRWCLSL